MYQILCDNVIIHDPRSEKLKVIEPTCDLQLNKTGALTFYITPDNPCYDIIKKLKSEITLKQDGEWIFTGRVLNDEIAFNTVKKIECEGEFAYLLDSVQRPYEEELTGNNKLELFLNKLMSNHNSQVENKKCFTLGNVYITDDEETLTAKTNYETTQECFNNIIKTYGGYFIDNQKTIDYVDNAHLNVNSQIIRFGENIIDITKYIKGEDVATVIIPLGKGSSEDDKLTISDIADFTDGNIVKVGDYIYDKQAVEEYGYIVKTVEYSEVEDDTELLEIGKDLLNYYSKPAINVELTALDLHLLDVKIDSIKIGDKIKVISIKHNLDSYMIVNSISIDIDNPQNTKIELISEDRFTEPTFSTDKTNNIDSKVNIIDKGIQDVKYDYDTKFTDYDTKLGDYDTKFDNYNDKFKNYDTKFDTLENNIGQAIGDYLNNGGTIDLSSYATINDVNNAFNSLAELLKGV